MVTSDKKQKAKSSKADTKQEAKRAKEDKKKEAKRAKEGKKQKSKRSKYFKEGGKALDHAKDTLSIGTRINKLASNPKEKCEDCDKNEGQCIACKTIDDNNSEEEAKTGIDKAKDAVEIAKDSLKLAESGVEQRKRLKKLASSSTKQGSKRAK